MSSFLFVFSACLSSSWWSGWLGMSYKFDVIRVAGMMETKFKANGVWKAAFQHFGESIGTWRSRIGPCIPDMPSWHRGIVASWHRGMLHGWWFTGFPISTPGCSTKWRQEGKHLKVTNDIKKQYYVPSWNHLQKLVSLDALLLLKCIFFSTITILYFLYIHL